ncbi:MAG: hypothetical protein NZ903_01125 [Candidatus Micrarchaeota archaeon]|nr:hypothetical protein [Candidatus Micrarchaeota archaeon]
MLRDAKSLEELRFAARYPFSKTAKRFLSEQSFKIDYEKMEFAKKRVIDSIFEERTSSLIFGDEKLYEKYLTSYPLARMIVSMLDPQTRSKFVNGEVKRAISNLNANSQNVIEEAKSLAKDLGIEFEGLQIDIETYLLYVPKTEDGRLVFQNVREGKVLLDEAKFLSFFSELIKQNIEAGLPIPRENIPKDIFEEIEKISKEIEHEIAKRKEAKERMAVIFTKSGGELAPCMARILERARNGENLPHFARVAIASYLLKKGKSIDEVVEVFSTTPNYNEKIARYQVEYIAKKGYFPPSCQMMESYGLRLPECGCLSEKRHKNPLYYRPSVGKDRRTSHEV